MKIPKQAIEKAIERGWKGRYPSLPWKPHPDGIQYLAQESIVVVEWYAIALDPSFWQALGKALKFDQPIWDCHKLPEYKNARCENTEFCEYAGWKSMERESLSFCEIILTSGDVEKYVDAFWADLLPTRE